MAAGILSVDPDLQRTKTIENAPADYVYSEGKFSVVILSSTFYKNGSSISHVLNTLKDEFQLFNLESPSALFLALKISNATDPVLHTCCPQTPYTRENCVGKDVICVDYTLEKSNNWQFVEIGTTENILWFDVTIKDYLKSKFHYFETTFTRRSV